jgi:tellurite resistance protein TehA-like permease
MGGFLLLVKSISIFKSHFAQTGLPEKQFLPSFLIVIPNITLFAISAFRLGHYANHYFGVEVGFYNLLVVVTAFAFETWYLMFGMSMLWDYFKKEFFKKEFYVSQWGLICPFVAYAVFGAFMYKFFMPNNIIYGLIILTTAIVVSLFFILLVKQIKCSFRITKNKINCL